MKTTAYVLLALAALTAAGASEREQRAEEVRERLALTDEQREQVAPVLRESFRKQLSIYREYGLPREKDNRLSLREARKLGKDMDRLRRETLDELSAFLTPEQLKEYRKIQQENKRATRQRLRSRR